MVVEPDAKCHAPFTWIKCLPVLHSLAKYVNLLRQYHWCRLLDVILILSQSSLIIKFVVL